MTKVYKCVNLYINWEIIYYNEKVRQWINNMPLGMRAYYARITERLIRMGPNLGMPFTRPMGNSLFELRIKAEEGISRIFYCFTKNKKIVVLHGFIKKSQQTPRKELKIAKKRIREINR